MLDDLHKTAEPESSTVEPVLPWVESDGLSFAPEATLKWRGWPGGQGIFLDDIELEAAVHAAGY